MATCRGKGLRLKLHEQDKKLTCSAVAPCKKVLFLSSLFSKNVMFSRNQKLNQEAHDSICD